ncbi:MAG TPA: hypothetical protein VFI12_09720 [Thermomicrobiales bacterium]|nr:hypothetical protein [Thermomicrobiales bacterium]
MCTRTVGSLGHYIEEEGLATTGISLIREHTEQIKPPRALWVPFELGRPFGPPNNPEFQLGVLHRLLDLFAEPSGPVLRDYPIDAPARAAGDEPWSCELPLPPLEDASTPEDRLRVSFLQEIGLMRPWYEEALREHRRTAIGLSGLSPDRIDEAATFVAAWATGETPPLPDGVAGPELGALRFIADDLKSFYLEAASVQPGAGTAMSRELNAWLYHGTWFGQALYDVRDRLTREAEAMNDPARGRIALVPGAFRERPPRR